MYSKPVPVVAPQPQPAHSVWRWNFGIGLVFVGAVLMYGIQFHDWKIAQVASSLGVAIIVAGVVLLTLNVSRNQPDEKGQESAKWLIRLVWVAAFGMGVIILYAIQYQNWVIQRVASCAGIGLITAGAAWLIGTLLGFIFGLPHSREVTVIQTSDNQQKNGSSSTPATQALANTDKYQRSTSLEQVSDWLTKMIVGVGLTQLNKIPGKLDQLATYIASGLLANGAATPYGRTGYALEVNRAFALGICIYFAVDGFLFGFLWASLDLLELFRRLDSREVQNRLERTEIRSETAEQKAAVAPDVTYDIIKARDEYHAIVEKRTKNEPVDLNRAQEYIKKLREYSDSFPTNRSLHVVLANLYDENNEWQKAVDVLTKFISARQNAGQVNDDDVATAWFNLACFYSTRAEKEQDASSKQSLLANAERYLINCLDTAKSSGPSTLALHLERAKSDEDLKALREAGVLDRIVKRYEN